MNGKIKITGKKKIGCIKIGFGHISEFDIRYERSIIKLDGTISITAPASFGHGCRIISEQNSTLTIGSNFMNTAKLTISNRGEIIIGQDVLISWDTWICDSDFHAVKNLKTGASSNPDGNIAIGNRVWIGAHTAIMKGAKISNGSIVAAYSLVKGDFPEPNVLLAGIPAKIVKREVTIA